MTRYKKGVAIETLLKQRAWNNGGWAFRAPMSGKSSLPREIIEKTPEQEKVSIKISVPHVDLGYRVHNVMADLTLYDPKISTTEILVSEVKSVRQHARLPEGKRVVRF